MFKGERVLGIVPARGGSKRLPGKNSTIIDGKPLLGWTLEAGINSRFVDKLILSTDDQVIGDIGRRFGADEVLPRPALLAGNEAPMNAVIKQVVETLEARNDYYGYLLLLQPTSPLRSARYIDEAFDLITEKGAVGVISVCQTEHPLEWMGKLSTDGFLDSFFQQTKLDKQSQEFPTSYQINGAIYIVPTDRFLKEQTLFLPIGMVAYVMGREVSVDIDDEYDLRLADWLLRQRERTINS
jgi:CMP-N-acetylneuraminic acid synthetase